MTYLSAPASSESTPKVERTDLVDDHDHVIGSKPRAALNDQNDRWRIVSLLVINTAGTAVLLAKRAETKKHNPGRWATAVCETLTSGEDYLAGVLRGTAEELGLDLGQALASGQVELLADLRMDYPGELRCHRVYQLRADLDPDHLAWDRTEASACKWWDLDVVAATMASTPEVFAPGLAAMLASRQ